MAPAHWCDALAPTDVAGEAELYISESGGTGTPGGRGSTALVLSLPLSWWHSGRSASQRGPQAGDRNDGLRCPGQRSASLSSRRRSRLPVVRWLRRPRSMRRLTIPDSTCPLWSTGAGGWRSRLRRTGIGQPVAVHDAGFQVCGASMLHSPRTPWVRPATTSG